jgi:hypothetical protein
VSPQLVELWCRSASRWPTHACLGANADSAQKPGKPHRHFAEQRRDPVSPPVLQGEFSAGRTFPVRIRGQWKYLYRAVYKAVNTVDFLLTTKRDRKAAVRFLYKAIDQLGHTGQHYHRQEWPPMLRR